MDKSILMPVYNEVDKILPVIDEIRAYWHGEIIIIDDGSNDGTTAALATRDDILVVPHPHNMGYGRSLIDGLNFAAFAGIESVVTLDADGQHFPGHIPLFMSAIDEADIVSGSRYLPQSEVIGQTPPDRRDINARITATIDDVTGWKLTDAFCGYKAFRIAPLLELGLGEEGYGFPMEVWAKAWRAGLRVIEVPVERIYLDDTRGFGDDLDDPEARYAYYVDVWERALSVGA